MQKGKIVLLNGTSSSGKSSLAADFIKKRPDYFHFAFDDFDLVIERMENRDLEDQHLIPVPTEYYFHRSIAMFADSGINLVVDHVLHDEPTSNDFFATLQNYDVLLVGVHCPLEELERRERERGDRLNGLAFRQLEVVHRDKVYDVEVDTHRNTSDECVLRILDVLEKRA